MKPTSCATCRGYVCSTLHAGNHMIRVFQTDLLWMNVVITVNKSLGTDSPIRTECYHIRIFPLLMIWQVLHQDVNARLHTKCTFVSIKISQSEWLTLQKKSALNTDRNNCSTWRNLKKKTQTSGEYLFKSFVLVGKVILQIIAMSFILRRSWPKTVTINAERPYHLLSFIIGHKIHIIS